MVFFKNDEVKICDLKSVFEQSKKFRILLNEPEYFDEVQILPGGYGVFWDINLAVSDEQLYEMGMKVPLKREYFEKYVIQRVVNASEAADVLDCSRQNVMDLTKRGKLKPIKTTEKNTLYLKSDVVKRKWK